MQQGVSLCGNISNAAIFHTVWHCVDIYLVLYGNMWQCAICGILQQYMVEGLCGIVLE